MKELLFKRWNSDQAIPLKINKGSDGSATLTAMNYSRMKVLQAQEYERKTSLGKAKLGGSWELVNTDGRIEGSEQLLGNWVLIYFGFTNCPDICPVEIEKMVNVVNDLEKDQQIKIPVVPVFISIDPQRDSTSRVKKYCEEFSPKLRGYTGSVEQTFRVYRSEGPKAAEDDYIVDHTVIMYLIDPDGGFQDYFGQNRTFVDIANAIRAKALKYQNSHKAKMSEKPAAPKRTEFSIKVPANTGLKRFSILKFSGSLNVDPLNWPAEQLTLEREDNRSHVFATESKQDFGEAVNTERLLEMKLNAEGKDRKFRSMREDSQYADYWVFLKVGDDFQAYKIKDQYQFLPCITHRTLDSEQAEEKFQHRNKVMNQFALKAQIQKTFRDQDEDAAMSSRTSNLKIKDVGSSDEDEDGRDREAEDADGDNKQKKRTKKAKNKPTASETNKREKKQRVENADEVAAYESDDGDDEGREYDYMSDSGSDTDREEKTVDQKVEEALVGVGDESGMKDNWDLDDSDPEEDEEDEEEKGKAVEKPAPRRESKKNGAKAVTGGDEPMEEGDSSGSDSDDPDSAKVKSVLFMQRKENRKRPHDEPQTTAVSSSATTTSAPAAKHLKINEEKPCEMPDVPLAAHAAANALDTDYVRRLLERKPHTTKELLGKVKPRCGQMDKESIIKKIAEILKNIQPYQFKQKVGTKKLLISQ
uniref:Transcription initiation factor IIF subunit alpha n=1 Tax=Ditylenchus dipsaci TaxID=166011 RepID=A0A915EQA0_9BILA